MLIKLWEVCQVRDSSAAESNALVAGGEAGELNKLDSVGRWMDREIGRDSENSLLATNYWNGLDTADDDKKVPCSSRGQLFSISDIAPVWAYLGVENKGKPQMLVRCCMFGEIEVSCDVLSDNIFDAKFVFMVLGVSHSTCLVETGMQ